jgi:hypothetical protein
MMRILATFALLALGACATTPEQPAPRWSIVVHGGAGVIERANLTPELEERYRTAMAEALARGSHVLTGGGSALDAVEAVITGMEDDPLFNAGRGAVFTAEGRNELDASIMDGRTRAAGAVAGVMRTRHPISLARAVMEQSPHVMHSFSVPVFRLKQDAIPGRIITGWFEATRTGVHDIQCVEMCGVGHGLMPARIFIESPAAHAAWVAKNAQTTVAAAAAQ